MAVKEFTIFNSQACEYDFEDMKELCAECREVEEEEVTDEEVWEYIYEHIDMIYDAERYNLNKELEGRVIALADIGTWRGRRNGYKVLGYNLNSILDICGCDDIKLYMDRHGVHSELYHHDGTNYLDYRMLREDRNVDLFLDKIYNNKVTENDIKYYTKSLRPIVKKIYGW